MRHHLFPLADKHQTMVVGLTTAVKKRITLLRNVDGTLTLEPR